MTENPHTRVALRVAPGANRPGIVGRHGDAWKVRVSAPPERGKANAEVVRLLAATLGVDRRSVEVVAGSGSRDKIVEVCGLTAAQIEARLEQACHR